MLSEVISTEGVGSREVVAGSAGRLDVLQAKNTKRMLINFIFVSGLNAVKIIDIEYVRYKHTTSSFG